MSFPKLEPIPTSDIRRKCVEIISHIRRAALVAADLTATDCRFAAVACALCHVAIEVGRDHATACPSDAILSAEDGDMILRWAIEIQTKVRPSFYRDMGDDE